MARNRSAFSRTDRVEHSVYGAGTIAEINERYTTIVFDDTGSKKFLTQTVALSPSDVPAPKKPVRRKKVASKA